MITTNQKSDLLDRISQVCAQLAETKASLESVDPQDEAAITAHQRVIHRILNGFIEKPVEFIPAGESTLWRVPVTSEATISGTALVRADSTARQAPSFSAGKDSVGWGGACLRRGQTHLSMT